MAPIINFKKLEENSRMQFKLISVSQLPQIAQEIKEGRQLRESKERVLKNILEGNGYRKMEDVDIKKPLFLGVLPRGNRYSLFLDVTPEIERIVRDNVRWVKNEVYKPIQRFLEIENKDGGIIAIYDFRKSLEALITNIFTGIDSLRGKKNDFFLNKVYKDYTTAFGKWTANVRSHGKWDYKRTHPIFSKVQNRTDIYSKYFVYNNTIITYDFLGNYNYAVTGMYALTDIHFADRFILNTMNKLIGRVDNGDINAVKLGIANYKKY